MIPLPAGYDVIYWHCLGGMRDAVEFCLLFTCTANRCFRRCGSSCCSNKAEEFSTVSHDWCFSHSRFLDPWPWSVSLTGLPKLKDSLFWIWTGCAPLQLHLSSAQVRRGDVFLSCWTSSVINKAGGSVPERVVLYCIVIENGYFPSDQLEQYHIVHLEVPFLHFKVFGGKPWAAMFPSSGFICT